MSYDAWLEERVLPKVDAGGDCWEWTASLDRHGYGQVARPRGMPGPRIARAHRAVYEGLVGSVPEGLVLDHLCRNRRCVNPDHLDPVTERTNILRGTGWTATQARKTRCAHGHPFNNANTYVNPRNGHRTCRACRRERMRGYSRA